MPEPCHGLFLCTGNSARSIQAEAILNREGQGRFIAHSAGSRPPGTPNPFALSMRVRDGFDPGFARSKSWDEFAAPGSSGPGAPHLDFIFTLCDPAAAEECRFWPGHPVSAHWGLPDAAAMQGSDAGKAPAFAETWRALTRRIQAFCELPHTTIDAVTREATLKDIGQDRA